jgi:hypothetical protein
MEESDGPAVTGIRARLARIRRGINGAPWLEPRGDEALHALGFEACPGVTRQCRRVTTQIRQLAGGFDDTLARNQIETSRGFLLESISTVWVTIVNELVSGEWIDAGIAGY